MNQLPDKNDAIQAEARLMAADFLLHSMADSVATAMQAKHFAKRDENKLEKKYIKKYLEQGMPASKAEAYALADEDFDKEDKKQREDNLTFTKIMVRWENAQRSHDAARSVLSYFKECLHNDL